MAKNLSPYRVTGPHTRFIVNPTAGDSKCAFWRIEDSRDGSTVAIIPYEEGITYPCSLEVSVAETRANYICNVLNVHER